MGVLERINEKLDTLLDEIKGVSKADKLLSSAEICQELGISEKTFPQFVVRLIPFGLKKVGGRWKMYQSDLKKYIKDED
jgi:hypothetical protein